MGIKDLQILISYKELQDLLDAVDQIPELRSELQRTQQQLTALRGLYSEVLDAIGPVMKLLRSQQQ